MRGGAPSRLIRLRRPVTLSVLEEPFVPEGGVRMLDEIDRRWANLCLRNPRYFDGRLFHVLGVSRNGYGGAVLHVAECAYRFYAVQDDGFDLGVRPLGVRGITVREGKVLMGRRSGEVASHPGRWEFAPGGVVDVDRPPVDTILAELAEETGLRAAREPVSIAVLHDGVLRSWEIVCRIEPAAAHPDRAPTTDEYAELRWCDVAALPDDLTSTAERMIDLAREVKAAWRGDG